MARTPVVEIVRPIADALGAPAKRDTFVEADGVTYAAAMQNAVRAAVEGQFKPLADRLGAVLV